MNKQAQLAIIEALVQVGYFRHGETSRREVRIPTTKNPVFGGIGGELTHFDGRLRMRHLTNPIRITIGPKTVNFYTVGARRFGQAQIDMVKQFNTKDVEAILEYVRTL